MGCSSREKQIRPNRRPRSVKSDVDSNNVAERTAIPESIIESGFRNLNCEMGVDDSSIQNANPNIDGETNPKTNFDDSGWGYCTEEQLEEILLKNLEFLYNEAIAKLVALGYDEDVALNAILRKGYCYGGMDVLTNVLHNTLAYLNSENGAHSGESEQVFMDLRQLEEHSLNGMVDLLKRVKPQLSKGDAMWCLLMSDLHVGRASVMEVPAIPSPGNTQSDNSVDNNSVGVVPPPMCRFHGGWGFGNGGNSEFPTNGFFPPASEMTLQREIECPKRFNLTPSMKNMLKTNVEAFVAGYRANSKILHNQNQVSALSMGDTPIATAVAVPVKRTEKNRCQKSQDVVNLVLSKFRELNLDENNVENHGSGDQKDEMILGLVHQIKDLEIQVKERKEWAQQKAMQAARKLSHDLTELKMLRMEREETQRQKKGKQTLEDTTMKRLTDMENALRKASGQVDRANAAVRKLETENAEIRAEMEASKLSASESVKTCLEVAKREKKCLKRLLAWEKQKSKLQEEITTEKKSILELQQELVRVGTAQKEAEANWRQEQKAKEQAITKVDEERRLKEANDINNKRKLESLRLKIEIDCQRQKDDIQRLEQELSRLKSSTIPTDVIIPSSTTGKNTIQGLLREMDNLEEEKDEEDGSSDRGCVICMKEEASVVFLPCAHQVLCGKCSDDYGKGRKGNCPCCRVPIEQRIRVYGASS